MIQFLRTTSDFDSISYIYLYIYFLYDKIRFTNLYFTINDITYQNKQKCIRQSDLKKYFELDYK